MAKQQFQMPTKSQAKPPINPAKLDAFISGAKDEQIEVSRVPSVTAPEPIKTFPYKSVQSFHERMVKAARYEGLSLKDFFDSALLERVERVEKSRT